jgi:uncharacterized low-complexity protein
VKAITKAIVASALALSVTAPAFAQSSDYGDRARADQHTNRHQSAATRHARNAFASESGFGHQANSPKATGGGSLGYNQKLLED